MYCLQKVLTHSLTSMNLSVVWWILKTRKGSPKWLLQVHIQCDFGVANIPVSSINVIWSTWHSRSPPVTFVVKREIQEYLYLSLCREREREGKPSGIFWNNGIRGNLCLEISYFLIKSYNISEFILFSVVIKQISQVQRI